MTRRRRRHMPSVARRLLRVGAHLRITTRMAPVRMRLRVTRAGAVRLSRYGGGVSLSSCRGSTTCVRRGRYVASHWRGERMRRVQLRGRAVNRHLKVTICRVRRGRAATVVKRPAGRRIHGEMCSPSTSSSSRVISNRGCGFGFGLALRPQRVARICLHRARGAAVGDSRAVNALFRNHSSRFAPA